MKNRWGALEITEIGSDPVFSKNEKGQIYDTGERGPAWWMLRCGCGHEFRIFEKDFPGRRLMRDCGREECAVRTAGKTTGKTKEKGGKDSAGAKQKAGRPSTERGHIYTLYLKPSTVEMVREYAQEKRISLSAAFTMLVYVARSLMDETDESKYKEENGKRKKKGSDEETEIEDEKGNQKGDE